MRRFATVAMLAMLAAGASRAEDGQPDRYEFARLRMGSPFRVTFYCDDEATANRAAEAAFARVKELNRILSDYEPDSEVNRLCETAGSGEAVQVSPELFHVLEASLKLSRRTDGAFDVTVGPVVRLWRRARRERKLPPQQRLREARRRVGWKHVELDPKARTVRLKQERMQLDFGGIAKGYAADEALRVLREHGVTRAMIDAGGDLVLGDPPPGEAGWRIGVSSLDEPDAPPGRTLVLADCGIATSGDLFQYVEIDGTRYSHIVDPQTGLGLTTRSSVTVIAPTGMQADALASTVSVLGPTRGTKLVSATQGVEALTIFRKGGRTRMQSTCGFPESSR